MPAAAGSDQKQSGAIVLSRAGALQGLGRSGLRRLPCLSVTAARGSSRHPADHRRQMPRSLCPYGRRMPVGCSARHCDEWSGREDFEPPAPASRRQCSTRLSYSPTDARGLRENPGRRGRASIGRGQGECKRAARCAWICWQHRRPRQRDQRTRQRQRDAQRERRDAAASRAAASVVAGPATSFSIRRAIETIAIAAGDEGEADQHDQYDLERAALRRRSRRPRWWRG